jgi:phosphoserine phosphatase
MSEPLSLWNAGPTRDAVLDFVARATDPQTGLPPEERVAVFDNDGTLWCEMPAPIQLGFLVGRLVEMAEADPALRDRLPWRAARDGDLAWFGSALSKHYAGDDTDSRVLAQGVLAAFADISVDEFARQAEAFLRGGTHPTLGRPYLQCAYAPMVQLLRHLEENGFTSYIVSGGGRDFMRPVTAEVYGVPGERVIGSAIALAYVADEEGGSIVRTAAADYLDDGPEKPVRIWNRTGRRPVLAAGNSNGDIEMLDWTRHPAVPTLRLLVRHDDAEREFDYVAGSQRALELAEKHGWTVVSVRDDWATVF